MGWYIYIFTIFLTGTRCGLVYLHFYYIPYWYKMWAGIFIFLLYSVSVQDVGCSTFTYLLYSVLVQDVGWTIYICSCRYNKWVGTIKYSFNAMPVQEVCKVEFPEYRVSLVIKFNLPVPLNPWLFYIIL